MLTSPQRRVLRYCADHPGARVIDANDAHRPPMQAIRRVSQRGAAGVMFWRLAELGLVEPRSPRQGVVLTDAGRKALNRAR